MIHLRSRIDNKRSADDARHEDGAVLIITALMLVVLLGFVGLTVDLGTLYVERRHAQTAVDVASLSGSQFGRDLGGTEAMQAINAEVQRMMAENLGVTATDWALCADSDAFSTTAPAGTHPDTGDAAVATPCVSFTQNLKEIRVRVPDRTIATSFIQVLGISSMSTSAYAVVQYSEESSSDIFPFGVPTASSNATLGCPSDYANSIPSCDGPYKGNFNRLFITQWGNDDPDFLTSTECNNASPLFDVNLAIGADHSLGSTSGLVDEDLCGTEGNVQARPSIVRQDTGASQSQMVGGLIQGVQQNSQTYPGRLTATPYATDSLTVGGTSYDLDDKPLWKFIGSGLGNVPASCRASTFDNTTDFDPTDGHPNNQHDWDSDVYADIGVAEPDLELDGIAEDNESFKHMWRCLREYNAGSGFAPLFTADGDGILDAHYDLQRSPRWGWSPVGTFGSGSSQFSITHFKPIFIQKLVAQCNANVCDWIWDVGEGLPSSVLSPAKIQSLVSFQLPDGTLPAAVIDAGPDGTLTGEYTLIE
jgi:Flp pilus assembly protein TadG